MTAIGQNFAFSSIAGRQVTHLRLELAHALMYRVHVGLLKLGYEQANPWFVLRWRCSGEMDGGQSRNLRGFDESDRRRQTEPRLLDRD